MTRTATIALFLLSGGLALASVNAQAPDEEQPPTKTVTYNDLKLASPEGVRSLHRRVFSAVMAVCGRPDTRELSEWADVLACRRSAMRQATVAVNAAIDTETKLAARQTTGIQVAAR